MKTFWTQMNAEKADQHVFFFVKDFCIICVYQRKSASHFL